MSSIKSANERIVYVTPGVFADGGGWELVIINGKLVVKPIPHWDGDPILWSSILLANSLQNLATVTEKAQLKPQLVSVEKAILAEYAGEIKSMMGKAGKVVQFPKPPDKELRYIYLQLFGCDGGGWGILPGGEIVKIPGWTPQLLIPLIGGLEQLAEVTTKKDLKPQLKAVAKGIIDAYAPELTRFAEQKRVEEFAHV